MIVIIAILLLAIVTVIFVAGYIVGQNSNSGADKYLDKYIDMSLEAFRAEEFDPLRATELRNAANQLLQARYASNERRNKLLGLNKGEQDGSS